MMKRLINDGIWREGAGHAGHAGSGKGFDYGTFKIRGKGGDFVGFAMTIAILFGEGDKNDG